MELKKVCNSETKLCLLTNSKIFEHLYDIRRTFNEMFCACKERL